MTTNEQYRELMRISRRFGTLLASGVPILQSMALIGQETLPPYAEAFAEMRQTVMDGGILSTAMERWSDLFPSPYRSLVYEGEVTGMLDVTVQLAADFLSPVAESGRLKTAEEWHGLREPIGLMQFTRQYLTLLSTGVMWWGRCLFILEHEAPPPYDGIARELQQQPQQEQRWEYLAERMGRFPQIFSAFYRAMVQTGDPRCGNLTEAMRYLDELLQEDWRLSQRVGWHDGRPSLIIDQGKPTPQQWTTLSQQEQIVVLTLFCRTIGMLLSSGISFSAALSTASHLLPKQQQETVIAAAQLPDQSDAIKALIEVGFLPEFVAVLLHTGLRGDTLEFTMNRAADTFHAEITGGG